MKKLFGFKKTLGVLSVMTPVIVAAAQALMESIADRDTEKRIVELENKVAKFEKEGGGE